MSYFDHEEAHNEPFIKKPAHISTRDVTNWLNVSSNFLRKLQIEMWVKPCVCSEHPLLSSQERQGLPQGNFMLIFLFVCYSLYTTFSVRSFKYFNILWTFLCGLILGHVWLWSPPWWMFLDHGSNRICVALKISNWAQTFSPLHPTHVNLENTFLYCSSYED